MKRFAALAYQQFKSAAGGGGDDSEWGDTAKESKDAHKSLQTVFALIDGVCPGAFCSASEFQALSLEMPLVLAPAQFVWDTFELLAADCRELCTAMLLRGHACFEQRENGVRAALPEQPAERQKLRRPRFKHSAEPQAEPPQPMPADDWERPPRPPREEPPAAYTGDPHRASFDAEDLRSRLQHHAEKAVSLDERLTREALQELQAIEMNRPQGVSRLAAAAMLPPATAGPAPRQRRHNPDGVPPPLPKNRAPPPPHAQAGWSPDG